MDKIDLQIRLSTHELVSIYFSLLSP